MVDVPMIQERLKRLAQYVESLEKRKTMSYEEFDEDKTIGWSEDFILFARYITDWLDRNGLSSPPDSKT